MTSLLVVGSVALDTLETPFGIAESVLGGSAVYFSLASRLFAPVGLVSVVGEDFPREHRTLLEKQGIGLDGLVVKPGETFRWNGAYEGAMNQAETREVQLNVFGDFRPDVPAQYRDTEFVFLANSSPHTQTHVCRQFPEAEFILADTMNLWIETEREALLELFGLIDGLILNDEEARQLTEKHNLIAAGRWVLDQGPAFCIIKKAEHGAMLIGRDDLFVLPGFPTMEVRDPTGAGDSFAGGFMGYAAHRQDFTYRVLRAALAYGTIVASFTIEDFGTQRLCEIGAEDLQERYKNYLRMCHLPDAPGTQQF
ncbi:MAG: PfkB family carbohydrate kinase [Candidatus Brocadiia bacterium]|nr:sugar kinase [Planctomycetota bacterium]